MGGGDDGGMAMREVIVVEGVGWERVLRIVDDAQIEHWKMLTLNLGAISKQDLCKWVITSMVNTSPLIEYSILSIRYVLHQS